MQKMSAKWSSKRLALVGVENDEMNTHEQYIKALQASPVQPHLHSIYTSVNLEPETLTKATQILGRFGYYIRVRMPLSHIVSPFQPTT
jgi:hypothetical protein